MLSRYSVKKPYTVLVAVIVIIILGYVSFGNITTDLLPDLDLPYVAVVTSYTGATPETVETTITKPVEQSLASTTGLKEMTSVSMENMSLVLLEFYQETDMNSVMLEMRENLDLISALFEDELISKPLMKKLNPNMLPVMVSTVSLKNSDAIEISDFVSNNILSELESLDGVAAVTTIGLIDEQINVKINDEKIEQINKKISSAVDGNLDEAQAALDSASAQLNEAESELSAQVAEQQAALDEANSQIKEGEAQLSDGSEQLDQAVSALNDQRSQLNGTLTTLQSERDMLTEQITALESLGDAMTEEQQQQLIILQASAAEMDSKISEVQQGIDEIDAQLSESTSAKAELDAQQKELDTQKETLAEAQQTLNDESAKAEAEISSAQSQLAEQQALLDSNADSAKEQSAIDKMITPELISGILAGQNFSMPAGYIENNTGEKSTLKVGTPVKSISGLQELVLFNIDLEGIGDITLNDVADVNKINNNADTYAKINGVDGVILAFQKQSDASTSRVCDNITEAFADLEKEYKEDGLSFTKLMSQGDYINIVTDSVLKDLLMGAVLAVIILFMFLHNYRPTLIVAISIPASVLFAIVMMYFSGVSLNVMSLGGLALGVGMLVDNSIVVIENIYRLRKAGLPVKDAAIDGAKQVAGAITASTLTTISAFVPFLFSNGLAKQLFIDMGLTIAYSLLASLFVALSIVPALSSGMLTKLDSREGRLMDKLKNIYASVLKAALKHRTICLLLSMALFVGSIALAVSSGTSLFPEMDSDELTATVSMKDEEATTNDLWKASDEISERILTIDDVMAVGAFQAGEESAISMNSISGDNNEMAFYIVLEQNKSAKAKDIANQITEVCSDLPCNVEVSENTIDMSALMGSGVSLNIYGNDTEMVGQAAEEIREIMSKTEGVKRVDNPLNASGSEYLVDIDRTKAIKKNLTIAQIYSTVAEELAESSAATSLRIDGKEYDVMVQDSENNELTAEKLKDLVLVEESDDSDEIVLSDVGKVKEQDSPLAIYRTNQRRILTLTAILEDNANPTEVSSDIKKQLKDYELPKGCSIDYEGESETVIETMTDLLKAIGLAIILVYLIMVAQFQSLVSPFIILFTLPLSFTGGFLLLFITGFDVSVIAMVGILVLSGIIVNNGIVLIDYVNQLRDKGLTVRDALLEGGRTRLRPILMTAMTTVLGLLTLAFGIGMGAEIIQPMAIVTIGGLLYGTITTLIILPIIYDILHRGRKQEKALATAQNGQISDAPAEKSITSDSNLTIEQHSNEEIISPTADDQEIKNQNEVQN